MTAPIQANILPPTFQASCPPPQGSDTSAPGNLRQMALTFLRLMVLPCPSCTLRSSPGIRFALVKPPPGCRLIEPLLKEPEAEVRPKAVHGLHHLSHIPFVFPFIGCGELLKLWPPRVDCLHGAF